MLKLVKFITGKNRNSTGSAGADHHLESTLFGESLSTTRRKGNLLLDKDTPEYMELKKLRRDSIRETIAKMERAQNVDLCFLVDCTSSMSSWITAVKDSIRSLESKMREKYKECMMRFAFVRYTDYDQPEESRISWLNFTGSTAEFVSFVDRISTKGGGDTAEDVIGGLKVVLSPSHITWNSDKFATKILVHIADAPAHGRCFHSKEVTDNHLDEDWPAFDPLMATLKQQNIAYWFGFVHKHLTDMMVEQFDKILQECKVDGIYNGISQFDAVNPEKLLETLENSVSQSISTMERSVHSTSQRKKTYKFQKCCPSFTPEDSEDVELVNILQCSVPPAPDRDPISYVTTTKNPFIQLCTKTATSIKMAKQPFSEGSQNIVYYARVGEGKNRKLLVVKECKFEQSIEGRKSQYLTALLVHGLADYYAKLFNAEKPYNAPEVYFNETKFCEQTKLINGSMVTIPYLYEPFMEGIYIKYNNNGGSVTKVASKYSDASQTFSHYTWVKSGKKLVVCDLQGVARCDKLFLTDPAIHSKDYMILQPKKGAASLNLGPAGIKKFFETHRCNSICKRMKLQLFDE